MTWCLAGWRDGQSDQALVHGLCRGVLQRCPLETGYSCPRRAAGHWWGPSGNQSTSEEGAKKHRPWAILHAFSGFYVNKLVWPLTSWSLVKHFMVFFLRGHVGRCAHRRFRGMGPTGPGSVDIWLSHRRVAGWEEVPPFGDWDCKAWPLAKLAVDFFLSFPWKLVTYDVVYSNYIVVLTGGTLTANARRFSQLGSFLPSIGINPVWQWLEYSPGATEIWKVLVLLTFPKCLAEFFSFKPAKVNASDLR